MTAQRSFIPLLLWICFYTCFCVGGDTEQNTIAPGIPSLKTECEAATLLCEIEEHRPSSTVLKSDEVDGWFLLAPLLLTKGILSKGIRVLINQRESIRKVGKILRNIYQRHCASPQSPGFFTPQQPENYKSDTLTPPLSTQDLEALRNLGKAYFRLYQHLEFVEAWGQEDTPRQELDAALMHAHYSENMETFHKALQAFPNHDSPALHKLTRQALGETLAFEHEIAQMCSWDS